MKFDINIIIINQNRKMSHSNNNLGDGITGNVETPLDDSQNNYDPANFMSSSFKDKYGNLINQSHVTPTPMDDENKAKINSS